MAGIYSIRSPLRCDGDRLLIDLAPPPDQIEKLYASLGDAFDESDWGWAARVLERLLGAGVEATAILDRVVALAAGLIDLSIINSPARRGAGRREHPLSGRRSRSDRRRREQ
jgi:hypothetical protein